MLQVNSYLSRSWGAYYEAYYEAYDWIPSSTITMTSTFEDMWDRLLGTVEEVMDSEIEAATTPGRGHEWAWTGMDVSPRRVESIWLK
jgi:hypothetical protein